MLYLYNIIIIYYIDLYFSKIIAHLVRRAFSNRYEFKKVNAEWSVSTVTK